MKPSPISDDTRATAALIWAQCPRMKPAGEARQKKHLAELEALRAAGVTRDDIYSFISTLGPDRYRWQWVSDIAKIAEHLPQIRAYYEAVAPLKPLRSESLIAQWRKSM